MDKLVSNYANALLTLSDANNTLNQDLRQAVLVRDILDSTEIEEFLIDSEIPNNAKNELFRKNFENKLDDKLMGFLYLMVQNNRERLIIPVLSEFILQINTRLGKAEARVVSAKPLSEAQLESIRLALTKKTDLQIEIHNSIDPEVLGGFSVLVNGKVFDSTIRTELNKMTKKLKRGDYRGS